MKKKIRYSWKNAFGNSLSSEVIEGSIEQIYLQKRMDEDKMQKGGYSSFRKLYLKIPNPPTIPQ